MHEELLHQIVSYGDLPEAVKWANRLGVSHELRPNCIQNITEDMANTSNKYCLSIKFFD